jgi:iron complex outermembrane receptor protein
VAFDGNYLQYYRFIDSSGQKADYKGTYDYAFLPELKFNVGVNYSIEKFLAGVMVRYVGAIRECASGACYDDPTDMRRIEAYYPVNLNVGYSFITSAGTTSIAAGIQNVLDKQPPYLYWASAANSDPSTYDYIGRYYYARLTQSF